MIANPDINSLIFMYNHYRLQADRCFDIYSDIVQAYFMYDYYIEMADIYERGILASLN